MVQCVCDICGKQTTQNNKYFIPTSAEPYQRKVVWQQIYAPLPYGAHYMDLCPECASEIGGYVASMILKKGCQHD